ncbi:hypothetical protein FH063_005038 [Azospirillum argentinense]|uniref:Uncharacterized protein n=1 Tax=Azospirillum argentinense TaxID=2970906 RepID=A0A5B0KWI5_9PROT|nr:hypothetical protein FH063_005038 [Azospirillum argentinense]
MPSSSGPKNSGQKTAGRHRPAVSSGTQCVRQASWRPSLPLTEVIHKKVHKMVDKAVEPSVPPARREGTARHP